MLFRHLEKSVFKIREESTIVVLVGRQTRLQWIEVKTHDFVFDHSSKSKDVV